MQETQSQQAPLLITDGIPVKKRIPGEVVIRPNGRFRLSDNPQIYQPICQWIALGLPSKDILTRVKESWGVDLPQGTMDAMHLCKKYSPLIAEYRKKVGPLIRKIPGVYKMQRLLFLSDTMYDETVDIRTRLIAEHELDAQTSDEKTAAMLAQADAGEVPVKVKEEKIIQVAISLLDKKDINVCLTKNLEERIIKAAYMIQKTRDMYSGKMINAKTTPVKTETPT